MGDSNPRPLACEARNLAPTSSINLTTNVSNKSGNLLLAPQKLLCFKQQVIGQLQILTPVYEI